MIRLTKDQVISIYEMLIQKAGGSSGVMNESLMDSAIDNIWQIFDGVELYPTLEEKGARLGFNLVSNHAFVDGNKRIGLLVMLTFLEINGINLKFTDDELVKIGLSLASGQMTYENLFDWIKTHEKTGL